MELELELVELDAVVVIVIVIASIAFDAVVADSKSMHSTINLSLMDSNLSLVLGFECVINRYSGIDEEKDEDFDEKHSTSPMVESIS